MSYISDVVILSPGGDDVDAFNAHVDRVLDAERAFTIAEIDARFCGGSKGPLTDLWWGGFNYLPTEEYAEAVRTFAWGVPIVTLLIMPEAFRERSGVEWLVWQMRSRVWPEQERRWASWPDGFGPATLPKQDQSPGGIVHGPWSNGVNQ